MATNTKSAQERNENSDLGMFMVGKRWAMMDTAWYDPWYIWIPNYRNKVLRAS